MNCKELKKYISELVDHELDHDVEEKLLKHLENCPECKALYKEEKMIKEAIYSTELEDLPNGFNLRLREKLEKENKNRNVKNNTKKSSQVIQLFKKHKKYFSIAAVLLLSVVLINNLPIGRGGYSSNDMAASEEELKEYTVESDQDFGGVEPSSRSFDSVTEEATEEAPAKMTDTSQLNNEYQEGRVIIKNGNISLDILDLEETTQLISDKVAAFEGYISNQHSSISYVDASGREFRNGSIQVKINSDYFDEFMAYAKNLGRLRNASAGSNDITNQYRDTVSRIENLEITQDRLRDLLKKSATVEETLQIERELTRIRGQLESLKGNIKNWDRLSQFSTISISLNEVESIEVKIESIDKNLLQKSKEGLMETINDIRNLLERGFIALVAYSPIIILIGLALLVIRIIYKRSENK